MRRAAALLLLASVATAGDAPTFQGLTADHWAARLADGSVRDEAGVTLARGGPEAIAILDTLLRTRRALHFLPYVIEVMPDPQPLVPALVLLLADDDAKTRGAAAQALCYTGPLGAPAVSALVRALDDLDQGVGTTARIALGRIGAPAVPALTEGLADPRIRGPCADALAGAGAAAAPAVAPLDHHPTPKGRGDAPHGRRRLRYLEHFAKRGR